jgi:hypothetical protein
MQNKSLQDSKWLLLQFNGVPGLADQLRATMNAELNKRVQSTMQDTRDSSSDPERRVQLAAILMVLASVQQEIRSGAFWA